MEIDSDEEKSQSTLPIYQKNQPDFDDLPFKEEKKI